jgi:hypothetical protein
MKNKIKNGFKYLYIFKNNLKEFELFPLKLAKTNKTWTPSHKGEKRPNKRDGENAWKISIRIHGIPENPWQIHQLNRKDFEPKKYIWCLDSKK